MVAKADPLRGRSAPQSLTRALPYNMESFATIDNVHRKMAWFDNLGYSYSLQRKFPFPYFTVLATIILCIVFIISTVYNVATNGYGLETRLTTDPNSTLATRPWYLSNFFTLGDRRLFPKCQVAVQAIGSQFTSTNLGFVYILKQINDQSGGQHTSISYLNNTLHDCNVTSVEIHLHSWLSTSQTNWWAWRDSYAAANSVCRVENEEGIFTITLATFYDLPPTLYATSAKPNMTTQASLWWGTQLMQCYWFGIKTLTGHDPWADDGWYPFLYGDITYNTVDNATGDVDSMDLFSLAYAFIDSTGGMVRPGMDDQTSDLARYTNTSFRASSYINEGLSFARIYYSLVQMDLGQATRPNLLIDDASLQRTLTSPGNINREGDGQLTDPNAFDAFRYQTIQFDGENVPLGDAYDQLKGVAGPLGTKPATLSLQYSCQAPNRKSTGTIVWSTILAGVVLLAAAKTLVLFFAEQILVNRDPAAFYCAGCASRARAEDLSELAPITRKTSHEDHHSEDHHHHHPTSDGSHFSPIDNLPFSSLRRTYAPLPEA